MPSVFSVDQLEPLLTAPPKSWLFLLSALIAFAPMSIDMYLPGLPAIAAEFGEPTTAAQFTLASFFIGLALGQAIHGPLADRYGRKPPLYAGLALYVLASIGCALAPNLTTLIALRFLQAVGGCAGIVIARAVARMSRRPGACRPRKWERNPTHHGSLIGAADQMRSPRRRQTTSV